MYGRVFESMFTGSMRGKGDLQLVWTYFLVHRSRDGICDFTPQCIADATGKPPALIQQCIDALEAPDEMSRTRSEDGRRLRRLDPERPWGWQIVNHLVYDAIATREAMREAERLRKRGYRSRVDGDCPGLVRDAIGRSTSTSTSTSTSESSEGGAGETTPPAGKTLAPPPPPPPPRTFKQWSEEDFTALATDENARASILTDPDLQAFLDHWREESASGRPRFTLERTWETTLRLRKWARNAEAFAARRAGWTGVKKPDPVHVGDATHRPEEY